MSLLDKIKGKSTALSVQDLEKKGVGKIQLISESELLGLVGSGGGGSSSELEQLRKENEDLRRQLAETQEELQSAGEFIQRLQELQG